jgi:AcrR family transcriptional regulator
MPRAGLDAQAVVAAAGGLADAEGLNAVTLARVAAELGVRPPSLYAHVGGLADLHERLALLGTAQLADVLQAAVAGRSDTAALRALADAYRDYARTHPGLYMASQRAGPGDELEDAVRRRAVDVVLAVLRGYELEGEDAMHATRAVRASLHGFVTLEIGAGFGLPLSLDDSYAALVAMLDRGLGGGRPSLEPAPPMRAAAAAAPARGSARRRRRA